MQQTVFTKQSSLQEASTKASFAWSYSITKQNKPFFHGEYLKERFLDAANSSCPETKRKFEKIALLRKTVVPQIVTYLSGLSNCVERNGLDRNTPASIPTNG